ncbi:MAG: signal peptidase I [Candidatus Tectomicrobia bacterium]|uniref:Signal peptidase I n=1 Tax=Tectimicrobiota bacterium TaxID=2528274 RepID=A0A932ZU21_UNCTE|nr:signal peptidase I [Candidatus Tectomicrobia bacterium]MBI4251643.1 signal peptidase I [Candidatus Tectomicrobia bacterium]
MTESQTAGARAEERPRREKSTFREYAEAIAIALLLALFVRSFVVQAFKIPSGSMEDTLLIGDHLLVNKFLYWIRGPQRGDIIVFRFPEDESRDFIKRVAALPGETVMIRGRNVYINCATPDNPLLCTPLKEPYAIFKPDGQAEGSGRIWGPRQVPPGHLLMLGDNRNNSQDSRFWNFLRMGVQLGHLRLRLGDYNLDLPFPCSLWPGACWDDKIRGVAFVIYWSWDSGRGTVRWNRLGKLLR